MAVSINDAWFCDRAVGKGVINTLTTPAVCVYDEAPVQLGNLSGGSGSAAWGTSRDGAIVVGFGLTSGAVQEALKWTNQGAPVVLTALPTATAAKALGC